MNQTLTRTKRWIIIAILLVGALFALCAVLQKLIVVKTDEKGVPRVLLDMRSIHVAMKCYKNEFDKYPTGDSHAIFQSLTGNNPRHITFIEFHPRDVNADGDLLDPWGTPYRVYFSGDELLVRSAGPNKRFNGGSSKDSDDYIY
ncbi:MAG: hypothetical protein HZC54_11860 [Verrucomicrobia bacterium]|nr:hypothetical protein [Verrucomicrobiota bacterium]